MDGLEKTVAKVVERHPAPALSLEELGALVARERPNAVPSLQALRDLLRQHPGGLRLLEGDPERIGHGGPSCWVVAPRGAGGSWEAPPGSIEALLRESLRTLGEAIEPGSNLALARWARLLREEERIRQVLDGPRRVRER